MSVSLSTKEDDCLPSKSFHWRGIPQVVTVSAIDELRHTVQQRDERIAFLEKELVATRMQLAAAKDTEDRLTLELKRAKSALLQATEKKSPPPSALSGPSQVSLEDADDSGAKVRDEPRSSPKNSPKLAPLKVPSNLGDIQVPLGQKLSQYGVKSAPLSRKRSKLEMNPSESTWHNLNPASCASGLNLLSGHVPVESTGTINRVMDNIGLGPAPPDCGAGGVHRAAAGSNTGRGNADWDSTFTSRRQQGSLFLNCLPNDSAPLPTITSPKHE